MPAETHYHPTGACAECPYRERCHDARKRVMDRLGWLLRHTCTFFRAFRRQERVRAFEAALAAEEDALARARRDD